MDIMVDIETLGTSGDSVILQLSAVPFSLGEVSSISSLLEGPKFNSFPTINSQTYARMDGETIKWWMTSPDISQEARERVFNNPMEEKIDECLKRFNAFLKLHNVERGFCRGANFDWPIINNAFRKNKIIPGLKYWAQLDQRTITAMFDKAKMTVTDPKLVKHDAISDCVSQIIHLQLVMKEINK